MADSLKFWVTYVILVAAVLAIGWHKPLRYRFMSKEEIAKLEAPVVVKADPTPWIWDSKRATSLDRGPYRGRAAGTDRRAINYPYR
ncbi:MAG TPA: hypothetical protein VFG14_07790 [Chthoniobacteraceae bacterium]|nr:hypothetical protein [Chthoniobacteraceae bacterium]